jgi:maltose alpha-D-glucosyltransferase/alpha-amylase
MVRSLDYAAAVALRLASDLPPADLALAERLCVDWRDRSIAAFLEGYRGADTPFWPADPVAGRQFFDLLLLDKVLYEIGYELDNRPAWLTIPVRGLIALLTEHGDDAR